MVIRFASLIIGASKHVSSLRSIVLLLALGLAFVSAEAQQPFAYVTNQDSEDVSVIDTAKIAVVATVPVGTRPFGVAITTDATRAYVANSNFPGSLSVIDTTTNTVIATVEIPNDCPFAVAMTPDGTRAYVTRWCTSTVSAIDLSTNSVMDTFAVGAGPIGIAISPDGAFAYVACFNSNSVTVVNTATNTVVATVPVGDSPNWVAITPDGAFAYVTNPGSNNVSVIDTGTNTVVATVPVGLFPDGVAITPNGAFAYARMVPPARFP